MTDIALPPEAEKYQYLFRKSLPVQVRLHETIRALGGTEGLSCLDIGADNGMVSYHLRKRGGNWQTLATNQGAADAVRAVVKDNVYVLEDKELPFKKQTFDAIVIFGFLERVADDSSFIEECHRLLKPDGRMVVSVAHAKTWSLIKPLRKMLGVTHEKIGLVRAGYSESQLFNILKHGFDVHHMRSYSRFFVELVDVLTKSIGGKRPPDEPGADKVLRRFCAVANIFYRIADQFDVLLFFTKGYYLIASAKRRAWRPRNTPVLVDGRSISEAVLTKPSN